MSKLSDVDVNAFRKPMNHPKAFGQVCAAFELEHKALSLKAPQAMHDPVVFFDQHGIKIPVVGHNRKQLVEVAPVVKKVKHPSTPESAFVWPCFRSFRQPPASA